MICDCLQEDDGGYQQQQLPRVPGVFRQGETVVLSDGVPLVDQGNLLGNDISGVIKAVDFEDEEDSEPYQVQTPDGKTWWFRPEQLQLAPVAPRSSPVVGAGTKKKKRSSGSSGAAAAGADGESPAKKRAKRSSSAGRGDLDEDVRVSMAVLRLTAYELKAELKQRGERVGGTKVELQIRLQQARDVD